MTHRSTKLLKPIVTLGLLFTLAGCVGIGESNFSCDEDEVGKDDIRCMPVRDVYERTNNDDYLTAAEQEETKNRGDSTRSVPESNHIDPMNVPENYVTPNLPDRPVPVRTPAEVMRVWIAPWEDKAGDLVTTGYLYTEIEPRRWVIGDKAGSDSPRNITPLR